MTEAQTITRCQRGDKEAFVELFSAYRDSAYRFCLGMVGDRQQALDISQEAFLAAFKGIKRLKPESGFAGWFYGILRHLCIASLRQRTPDYGPEVIAAAADPGPSPESSAEQGERRAALAKCLQKLTPIQREVILLREFENLSYGEIAARLEVPQGTVMSRLYDARHALREIMVSDPHFAGEL